MMQHKTLENGRWAEMSFIDQMANIGSEIHRTSVWGKKKNADRAEMAFDRALELIDLTLKYGRQHEPGRNAMLKELCRLREIFCAEYLSENPDALESSDKFFLPFGMAAARRRQKTGAATE